MVLSRQRRVPEPDRDRQDSLHHQQAKLLCDRKLRCFLHPYRSVRGYVHDLDARQNDACDLPDFFGPAQSWRTASVDPLGFPGPNLGRVLRRFGSSRTHRKHQLTDELSGCQLFESRVRTALVVIPAPRLDDRLRFTQRLEPMQVQVLAAE